VVPVVAWFWERWCDRSARKLIGAPKPLEPSRTIRGESGGETRSQNVNPRSVP